MDNDTMERWLDKVQPTYEALEDRYVEVHNAALEEAAKVVSTDPNLPHTAFIDGHVTVVESHPTKYVTYENHVRVHRVIGGESCFRCVLEKWQSAVADRIRELKKG